MITAIILLPFSINQARFSKRNAFPCIFCWGLYCMYGRFLCGHFFFSLSFAASSDAMCADARVCKCARDVSQTVSWCFWEAKTDGNLCAHFARQPKWHTHFIRISWVWKPDTKPVWCMKFNQKDIFQKEKNSLSFSWDACLLLESKFFGLVIVAMFRTSAKGNEQCNFTLSSAKWWHWRH